LAKSVVPQLGSRVPDKMGFQAIKFARLEFGVLANANKGISAICRMRIGRARWMRAV
jgi:hypothetical protein